MNCITINRGKSREREGWKEGERVMGKKEKGKKAGSKIYRQEDI